ncbi:MAG: Gx transporter family protein [bacterium]
MAARRLVTISLIVSGSVVLQVVEALYIPRPLPWLRLGLSNMMVLVAIASLGWRSGLCVAVLRSFLSSLLVGGFLGPSFLLSAGGGLMSCVAMILAHSRGMGFGLVGVSVIGSTVNNVVQLILVYIILVRHPGVFLQLPALLLAATASGAVTGLGALFLTKRLSALSAGEVRTPSGGVLVIK